jgi:hypothetical protein
MALESLCGTAAYLEEAHAQQVAHRLDGVLALEHALHLRAHALLTHLVAQGRAHLVQCARLDQPLRSQPKKNMEVSARPTAPVVATPAQPRPLEEVADVC